jgi:uncharacterized protein (TIGR03000 family)
MCKRSFLFPTVVACALVTFFSTAQASQAQYIGDRAGWSRGGVIPGGAYYAAYGQAGYGPSFGYLRWGWGWGMRYWFGGWGLSSYWPSVWGGYPNYVSPDWLYSEPYHYSEPNVYYYYPPTQVNLYPGYQSNYSTATVPVNAATIQVMVPPNAEVWIDGKIHSQVGAVRSFATDALLPGKTSRHEVRVSWMVDGQPVTQTREIQVQAGNQRIVNFMVGG